MNNINDEILNKYLDDELNREEMNQVKTAIENSAELKKKYKALLSANTLLKNMESDLPSFDFSKNVIGKIKSRKSTVHQQKYFLFTILSLFGLVMLGITGYVFYEIISSVQVSESSEIITNYSKSIGEYFSGLFGKKSLSIFGSVLSFIILISGYFLFDYQKHSKKYFSH
jgi:cytochrome b subunit of formate dehydrogenase